MPRITRITFFVAAAVVWTTVAAFAAGPAPSNCEYIKGPATPVSFAPDPSTGLISFTTPFTFGNETRSTNLEVAILGFLNVSAAGFPERALVTHTWQIPSEQLELDWAGEASLTPTNDPTIAHYTIRLDIKNSNRQGTTGTLFADGTFNLTNGTGTAGDFFGKVCQARSSDDQ